MFSSQGQLPNTFSKYCRIVTAVLKRTHKRIKIGIRKQREEQACHAHANMSPLLSLLSVEGSGGESERAGKEMRKMIGVSVKVECTPHCQMSLDSGKETTVSGSLVMAGRLCLISNSLLSSINRFIKF